MDAHGAVGSRADDQMGQHTVEAGESRDVLFVGGGRVGERVSE